MSEAWCSKLNEIEELADFTRSVAVDVAKWLKDIQSRKDIHKLVKWSYEDVTRKVDLESEEKILQEFKKEHYRIHYVSEERGIIRTSEHPEYIVVVDPLDGSNNYSAGIPYASISIAIAKYSKIASLSDIIIGVVADIFRDKVYYAIKNRGAFENNSLLTEVEIEGPPFILGYLNLESYDVFKEIERIYGPFKLRSLGSASLDIVNVARGVAGVFIDLRSKLRNIDIAAALLILHEMKGKAVSLHMDLMKTSILSIRKVSSIIAYGRKFYEKYKIVENIAKEIMFNTTSNQPTPQ